MVFIHTYIWSIWFHLYICIRNPESRQWLSIFSFCIFREHSRTGFQDNQRHSFPPRQTTQVHSKNRQEIKQEEDNCLDAAHKKREADKTPWKAIPQSLDEKTISLDKFKSKMTLLSKRLDLSRDVRMQKAPMWIAFSSHCSREFRCSPLSNLSVFTLIKSHIITNVCLQLYLVGVYYT